MKPSHTTTPRTMSEGCWHTSGEAFHGFPERDRARVANIIFATVLGILGAVALLHWWSA